LRFWGKISGIEKDYYIVEAVVEGEDEGGDGDGDEQKEDIEPKGSGVNKFSYYVSHSSVDSWKKLPDLSPNDIKASRAIKVLFTGNLERYIHTNPFFFGQEKHYLRAQIARISHSTGICPKGQYKLVEDNERDITENVDDEEQPVPLPSTKQLADLNMWVHSQPNILMCNRTQHPEPVVPEDQEDVDPDELKK